MGAPLRRLGCLALVLELIHGMSENTQALAEDRRYMFMRADFPAGAANQHRRNSMYIYIYNLL